MQSLLFIYSFFLSQSFSRCRGFIEKYPEIKATEKKKKEKPLKYAGRRKAYDKTLK